MHDDSSFELKHVALRYMTLKCRAGRCILFICDTGKHNGMYRNKKNNYYLPTQITDRAADELDELCNSLVTQPKN
jgi:hypothetical protein